HMDVVNNPSNQPRMAIGYSVFGQLGLLHSMGLLDLTDDQVNQVVAFLKENANHLSPEQEDNQAMQLAQAAQNKLTFLVSAEYLHGPTHVFNNPLNENAKHLTAHLRLPEINQHYPEALVYPESAKDHHLFWFFT